MSTYRFPALIWEDHAEHFTAALAEDDDAPAGFGATPAEAAFQVKEYLDGCMPIIRGVPHRISTIPN
jgi:hypothetical protein